MKKTITLSIILAITGCANNQSSQSNFYTAEQANQQMESKLVTVLLVMPARVEVDNSQNKKNAQIGGALLGALAGIAVSRNTSSTRPYNAKLAGGAVGGVAGVAAGSMVSDKKVVDGVSVTYKLDDKHFTAIQVGKVCQFKLGSQTLMIKDDKGKTRIQPNTTCPVEKV